MKKIIISIILLLIFTSCSSIKPTEYKKQTDFLGSIADEKDEMVLLLNSEVNITTVNDLYRDDLINTSKEMIRKYHILLDNYHYYLDSENNRINNIKVLNDNIDNGPVKVDPIIIDAIKKAIELTKLTNGYFNFTIGELTDLYNDKFLPYDSYNIDPPIESINKTLDGVLKYDEIENYILLDEIDNTVELKSKDNIKYLINLGGFSKGYILENVYNELISYNTSFLISAGSSSIVSYTNEDEDISWNVGIKNPTNSDSLLMAFNLNNGSISTSGDYENYYYLNDGTKRHHIFDPFSGYSRNYYHSITLLSSNASIVDALTTALFSIDDENKLNSIIDNVKNYYDIDIDYCFIDYDNNIDINQRFYDLLIDDYNNFDLNKIFIAK